MKRRGQFLRQGDAGWTAEFSSLGGGGGGGDHRDPLRAAAASSASSALLDESAASFLNLGAASSSSLFSDLGAFPSFAPSNSSVFGYSQKNFHISDGNLYSVLSPFQARRSNARPSFLRGQSCVTSTCSSETSSTDHHLHTSSVFDSHASMTTDRSSRLSGSVPFGGQSSSKLKFHNQQMPPKHGEWCRQYKDGTSDRDGPEDVKMGFSDTASSWFDDSSFRKHVDAASLLSKRLKSQRTVTEDNEEEVLREATEEERHFRHHDEWESEELSMTSSRSFHKRHLLNSSSCTTTRSDGAWDFDDEDDEDEEEEEGGDIRNERAPLNLCLADCRNKLPSFRKNLSEKLSCKVDRDAEDKFLCNRDFPHERKFSLANIFDDLASRKKFQVNRSRDDAFLKTSHCRFEDDEAQVLDLSMKGGGHESKKFPFSPSAPSSSALQFVPPSSTIVCHQEVEHPSSHFLQSYDTTSELKPKKFPLISEMFKNMRLQDDDRAQHAMKRYNATRQLLMHTHPEMFVYDWDNRVRTDLLPEEPQYNKPPSCPEEDTSSINSHLRPTKHISGGTSMEVPHRPRSWDVSQTKSEPMPDAAVSRPESAEPCLEMGSLLSLPSTLSVPSQLPSPPTESALSPYPDKIEPVIHHLPPLIPSASYSLVQQTQHQLQKQQQQVHSQATRRSASAPSIASGSRAGRHWHMEGKNKVSSSDACSGGGGGILRTPKVRQRRNVPETPSSQFNNDISICKFKLIKGAHPALEEKKSIFVPMPRPPSKSADKSSVAISPSSSTNNMVAHPPQISSAPSASSPFFVPSVIMPSSSSTAVTHSGAIGDKFRTFKIHLGSQEEIGRKLAAGKRLRRRSRKAIAREKLEATFREQGFLIKTQQVSSAEGSVYCKFRQLRKFTRYLFKSWKDYLPKELDDIASSNQSNSQPP